MPAKSFRIYPKRNLVSIRWKSPPSTEDWYEVLARITADREYRRGMNFLTYRCGYHSAVTSEHVRNVLGVLEDRSDTIGPASLAIVARTQCDFGMARMMETLSDTTTIAVRAFHGARDACEWLRDPAPYASNPHVAFA